MHQGFLSGTQRATYINLWIILIILMSFEASYGCQEFFNYRDLSYVPTFSLPALVPPDRGLRLDGMKAKWLFWGYMEPVFDKQGGCFDKHKVYANNEFLTLAQVGSHCDTLNFRSIFSVEPGTIGKCGYPLLFSTGYTANGITELLNAYPPLDFVTELSGSYVHQWQNVRLYGYFGLPGAPVLNLLPQQRIAEFFMPTGSITHRYMTSTDIVYGVGSAGLDIYGICLEGSLFTGKSQDERYWKVKKPHFDSFGVRLSYCYEDAFSFQVSYGHIKDTDPVELCVKNKRFLVSAAYNVVTDTSLWNTTIAYAHNHYCPGESLHSALFESCYILCDRHIVFGRYEYTQTDAPLAYKAREDVADMFYKVQKIGLGYRYQFQPIMHALWSLGVSGDVSLVPSNLKQVYGNHPFSWYLFLRVDLA